MMSNNSKLIEYFNTKRSVGGRKYLVAYSGYSESKACWLLENKVHNALEIIYNYKVSHGLNWHFTIVFQLGIFLLASLWTDVK